MGALAGRMETWCCGGPVRGVHDFFLSFLFSAFTELGGVAVQCRMLKPFLSKRLEAKIFASKVEEDLGAGYPALLSTTIIARSIPHS